MSSDLMPVVIALWRRYPIVITVGTVSVAVLMLIATVISSIPDRPPLKFVTGDVVKVKMHGNIGTIYRYSTFLEEYLVRLEGDVTNYRGFKEGELELVR